MPTTSLLAAATDGRAQNPRYIQRQLRALHDALLRDADVLQQAAVADGRMNADEALLEVSLVLAAVREHFLRFDVKHMLDEEYRVANGQDWLTRRLPADIVYIRPQPHTWLYSAIIAFSSAIAAGCCVMLEIPSSLSECSRILRHSLLLSLDNDTFSLVEDMPDNEAFTRRCLVIDQTSGSTLNSNFEVLQAPPKTSRVVAVVDRHADIESAAAAIAGARIAFNGRSPYAPDLVLVNEFVLNEFVQAAVKRFTKHLAGNHQVSKLESSTVKPRRKQRDDVLSAEERTDPKTSVALEGDNGMLAIIGNRDLAIASKKITGPNLIVHPISSLDDAIDCANSPDEPLLAAYHFATLPAAKYTSQYVVTSATFVNHIPLELLLGPPAPSRWPTSADHRYRPEMLSKSSPIRIVASGGDCNSHRLRLSFAEVTKFVPLPKDDQREGKTVGFFDQGLITGVTTLLAPMVGGLAVASFYGVRFGIRWMRS